MATQRTWLRSAGAAVYPDLAGHLDTVHGAHQLPVQLDNGLAAPKLTTDLCTHAAHPLPCFIRHGAIRHEELHSTSGDAGPAAQRFEREEGTQILARRCGRVTIANVSNGDRRDDRDDGRHGVGTGGRAIARVSCVDTCGDGWYGEEIDRAERGDVIRDEGSPGLRRWTARPPQNPGNGSLRDLDAQFLQLAMDPRRAPKRIRGGDLHHECPNGCMCAGAAGNAPR